MSTAIVWFRRDLRLHDQPALAAACTRHERIIPIWIHAPGEDGDWPAGAASRWWLHHSLAALSRCLHEAGTALVIRQGPTRETLAGLLDETGAQAVYWNRLYEPATLERDRAIKQWLRTERGIEAESFNAALLVEPWDIATGKGQPYRVFTPFWKQAGARVLDAVPSPPPRSISGPVRMPAGDPLDQLALLPSIPWDEGLGATWDPGEHGALSRLADFVDGGLRAYENGRDRPALDGTSALSPSLHFGEIGPRQILAAVRNSTAADSDSAQRFLIEIGWREFAHHLLFHFPQTPVEPLDPGFAAFPWRRPKEAQAALRAWQTGTTGIPLVDAGMRQLWYSGWMHNRVRMVVASFLTKNLRLHWLEGARWFWNTLVDADLASNTLGWQWAGGCGADAAPYFRIFNPVRQGERFDPDGTYVRTWVRELAHLPTEHLHAPWQAPAETLSQAGVRLGRDYPDPVVDLAASRQAALAAFQVMKAKTS